MAGETPEQGGALPPKIDLRKNGMLKPMPFPVASSPAPVPKPTTIGVKPAEPIVQPEISPSTPTAVHAPVTAAAPQPTQPPHATQPKPADTGTSSETMRITVPDVKPGVGPAQPVIRPVIPMSATTPKFSSVPQAGAAATVIAPAPRPTQPPPTVQANAAPSSSTMRINIPPAGASSQPFLKPQIPGGPILRPNLTPPLASAVPVPRPTTVPPVPTTHAVPKITPPATSSPGPAAAPVNAETMRITIPDIKPASATAPLPPLEIPGIKPPAPTTVKGPTLQPQLTPRPAPVRAVVSPEAKTVIATKKETSRIPLEMAAPSQPGISEGKPTEVPRTIRIKPPSSPGVGKIGPVGIKPPAPAVVAGTDEKRKTSRISLEAAFAEETSKTGEGPKTIKLKRPTEAATIKVGPKGALAKPEGEGAGDAGVLNKTARLDIPVLEEEGPTPTRKKTIRIKRPGGEEEYRESVSLARVGAESGQEKQIAAIEDEISWVFPVLSFVTILVMVVLIYIIMATGLAPDMGWIGKVVISR